MNALFNQCKCLGSLPFSFEGHCVLLLCVEKGWWIIGVCSTWKVEAWILSFFFKDNHVPHCGNFLEKKMEKNETTRSTCGYYYWALKCYLKPCLNIWNLSSLPCVRFWDLLKMNVVLTHYLSWKSTNWPPH